MRSASPHPLEESYGGTVEKIVDEATSGWLASASSTIITVAIMGIVMSTPTVAGVRIASLVGGALVAGNHLPQKLTPLIRAIMTSPKSETDSEYMHFTCTDSVALLQLLAIDKENIRDKVLDNLRKLSDDADDNFDTPTKSAAKKVMQDVVRNLPEGKKIQDLPPIWRQRVTALSPSDPSNAETFPRTCRRPIISTELLCLEKLKLSFHDALMIHYVFHWYIRNHGVGQHKGPDMSE